MIDRYRWQAPGNGQLFDSSLEEWEANLMSQRCIGVLNYIDENEDNYSNLIKND